MIQRIASVAMTASGVVVASEPHTDSAWSLAGVVASVLGGIWLMARTVFARQEARIGKLETDNETILGKDSDCQKALATALERLRNLEHPETKP